LPFKFFWKPDVVRVQKGNQFSASFLDTPVSSSALAPVEPEEVADPCAVATLLGDERLEGLTRSIFRSVVNDDDLELGVSLRQNTAEGGLYLPRPVESRDNHGYQRIMTHCDRFVYLWRPRNLGATSSSKEKTITLAS
jgi:hypothetical protein